MKGLIVHKQRIFLCMGMILAILGCWNMYNHAKALAHISLEVDVAISDATKKKIESLVYTAYAQSKPDAQSISQIITNQFPCIKSVHICYEPPHLVNIACKARKPYCLLNYDFVLTAEAIPVHKNAFKPQELERLHRVMLNAHLFNNQDVLNVCKQCIADLPSIIFETYQVTWVSPIEVQLLDEKNNFSVVVDMHNPPNLSLLSQCDVIKDELQQKGVLQKSRERWIADTRFSNQIIVNKGARGNNYG